MSGEFLAERPGGEGSCSHMIGEMADEKWKRLSEGKGDMLLVSQSSEGCSVGRE